MALFDESTNYISLRTYRKTGIAVDTPVWFAHLDPQTLIIFSAGEAGKVKRLRHTREVQIAVCDFGGKLLNDWCDAKGELVSDSVTIQSALQTLRKKYGWQMFLADVGARLTGKFNKRAYIKVTLSS